MADAGRAMMLYKGLYDSTYTYEKLDVVNYNGSLYISTVDGNLDAVPTNEEKWQLFLKGGIADNVQATDTQGLVGEAGANSFVQLLLDSLASRVGKDGNGKAIESTYIPKVATLNTSEEIQANTSAENIAGALAVKELLNVMGNVSGVAKIIAPAPTSIDSYEKIAPYPEGYSKNNSYIVTANITNGSEYIVNSGYSFFPALGRDGIYGFVNGEFWTQQTVGILLIKY